LVVADKFQTGYDEPFLHTMYVDKILTDIKAVQTLSRLNRAHPQKSDTFVLDFANEPEDIQKAFERYYRTTLLSGETDPNKLYDLIATIDNYQVFTSEQVNDFVTMFLSGADRPQLDALLDACVVLYKKLDEDGQVTFKSAAKNFVRAYGFLGAILPYGNPEWEKLSIFLNLLLPKLPSPIEEDFSKGIIESIDLDSYRAEAKSMLSIQLEDADAEVEPIPVGGGKGKAEPELDWLTNILSTFNELFGNIEWKDADNVRRQIAEIPAMVAKDEKYQNAMRNSDKQNARLESDNALQKVIFSIMSDNLELFKQFSDNPSFQKWLADMVFNTTYKKELQLTI
jgi:type I restriction enzyme R subunit